MRGTVLITRITDQDGSYPAEFLLQKNIEFTPHFDLLALIKR